MDGIHRRAPHHGHAADAGLIVSRRSRIGRAGDAQRPEAGAADFLPKQFEDIARIARTPSNCSARACRAWHASRWRRHGPRLRPPAPDSGVSPCQVRAGGGGPGAGRRQGRARGDATQSRSGHRHLHRRTGGLAAGIDQTPANFPSADPAVQQCRRVHAGLAERLNPGCARSRSNRPGRRYLVAGDVLLAPADAR